MYSSYLFYSPCIQAIYSILFSLYASYLFYSPCIQAIYSILPVFIVVLKVTPDLVLKNKVGRIDNKYRFTSSSY